MPYMSKTKIFALLLVLISLAVSFWLYPQVPNILPSHWGADGKINGYSNKETAIFLFPAILALIYLLFSWLPKADPKQENSAFNQKYLDRVILALMVFLFVINMATFGIYLGYAFNYADLMLPMLGILFAFIGKNMENIKPNWFFGIRTPWTINDEEIWAKTHKLGSKMFFGFGVSLFVIWGLSWFGLFGREIAFSLFLGEMIAVVVWSFVYPYQLWKAKHK